MTDKDKPSESSQLAPKIAGMDVVALLVCWGGAAAVAWASKEPVVAVVALALAYYLAKWIILKKRD